ncbi:MAG TPA: rhodanese-like domain-containing protein, partial [Terricaulis sp.]|nr:rhodanese-like domain-containing protein [Terricaulis sp.]
MNLPSIDPQTLQQRLKAGDTLLIDVREQDEHAREHIAGARLVPLSALDAHDFNGDEA